MKPVLPAALNDQYELIWQDGDQIMIVDFGVVTFSQLDANTAERLTCIVDVDGNPLYVKKKVAPAKVQAPKQDK
ncbi:MAG: hypothetical protein EBR82_17580 [Caulobacteraceae bacterium]|nr:hypothetical protein [Caulobacteraceae bacterium]